MKSILLFLTVFASDGTVADRTNMHFDHWQTCVKAEQVLSAHKDFEAECKIVMAKPAKKPVDK